MKKISFSSFHPLVLFGFFAAVLLFSMFTTNPVIQLEALIGAGLFLMLTESIRQNISNLAFYGAVILLVTITNPLFSHNGATPLFFMNGNPVTIEAFAYGASTGVMLAGVMLWCRGYSHTMTSDKFIYLFGRIIPKLSLVISMIFRFIPLFKRQIKQMTMVQRTMGVYSDKSIIDKLKGSVSVFSAMVTWSLDNAIGAGMSMRARGYGMKGRTCFSLFRVHLQDFIAGGIILFASAMLIFCMAMGWTDFWFYPDIAEIPCDFGAVVAYVSFGITAVMPFLIEIKENIKWRFLISKI